MSEELRQKSKDGTYRRQVTVVMTFHDFDEFCKLTDAMMENKKYCSAVVTCISNGDRLTELEKENEKQRCDFMCYECEMKTDD